MKIYVCVGSSCHLKGSYDIISLIKEYIQKNSLHSSLKLYTAFCLGKCTSGVTIKINDEIICGVTTENLEQIFDSRVLCRL